MGVLCQRRSITRPVRLVAAFNPHPDPPPDYRERGKRLWRINLRSPGKSGTLDLRGAGDGVAEDGAEESELADGAATAERGEGGICGEPDFR